MRRRINIWANIDWITVVMYLLLVFMGWVNIYAAVYNEEHHSIFDFSMRYGKQLVWISAAILIAIAVFIVDINFYSYFAYAIYGLMIFLLIIVLFFGIEVHGAKSWIEFAGIRIQPTEFAKIATALVIARYLSSYNVQINTFKSYWRLAAIILIPSILTFLQNDTGSALVYFVFFLVLFREGISTEILLLGVFMIILFVLALIFEKLTIVILSIAVALIIFSIINRRLKQVGVALSVLVLTSAAIYGINEIFNLHLTYLYLIFIALGISALIYIILAITYKVRNVFIILIFLFASIIFAFSIDYVFDNFLAEHQQKRINVVLGLESDPYGVEYNVNQSKIAIGSGGFSGKGFLRGTQTKYDFVPEQSTDFIFCTIGEEWGFLGTFTIVTLFVIFLLRLIFIAERQRSAFSRIYGYGVISILFFHVAVNIGMTIGLVPVIGIPLPFFSYGGSSLWAFTILVFILLRLDASRLELLR